MDKNTRDNLKEALRNIDPGRAKMIEDQERTEKLNTVEQAIESIRPEIEKSALARDFIVSFFDSIKGEKGDVPTKGQDYFTDEDIQKIKEEATPIKGKDYFTDQEIEALKEIVTPVKGVHYHDGEDGETPNVDEIIVDVLKKIRVPKDGKNGRDGSPDSPEQIAKKINLLTGEIDYKVLKGVPTRQSIKDIVTEMKKLPVNERLDISDIRNWNQPAKGRLDQRWHGGGATRITDLTDVSLSSPTNGQVLSYNSTTGKWTNSTGSGSGTVTSVATGTGLTGGTITTTGTISLSVPLQPLASLTGNSLKFLRVNSGETAVEYATVTVGSGTVTTVSVVSANGFAGTVANATTTPAITLTTSITGVLKGNGTAISAATAGSDYAVGSIGLAGGQTIAGSTLTAENLTLRANAADLTTGAVIVSSSKEATSSTVGSVQLAGGLAVAKRVFALDMTVTNTITGSITGNAATVTTNANLTGPITSVGNATTVASSINLPGSPTTTTQSQADNSTKIATTAYVDLAVLGQNFKEACRVATTANLVGTYLAGVFTYTATGTDSIDGVTLVLNDRVLVKNQTDTTQNGIYKVTTAGAIGVAGVLTRATDANASAEFKTGDSLFVTAGTTLTSTTWAYTGADSPTIGSDAITYVQVAGQGSFTGGNGITITGTSIAINTAVTADLTTAQVFTNKTLIASTNVVEEITTTASSATPTPTGGSLRNFFTITAQAAAAAFAAPSGSPANGNYLTIRILDNGTARALTWNAIYRAGTTLSLPTTTVISKTMYVGFRYNSASSTWDLLSYADGF